MYININDNCEYNNPSESQIEEIGLILIEDELENKFINCKFPKLIIENDEIVDIIEDSEKNNIVDEMEKLKSVIPTNEEILKAESKIEILNTLKEVGLIE